MANHAITSIIECPNPGWTTIPQETLDELINALSEDDVELSSRILNYIGDLTRENGNRDFIGAQQNVVEKVVKLLYSDTAASNFAARVVANLSYQHEQNRKVVVDLGAAPQLVKLLQSTQDSAAQRNIIGAIANVSFVEDELQKQIVDLGVMELLLNLLNSDNDGVVIMSLRALANIVDTTTREVWNNLQGLRKVVEILFSDRELEQDTLSALSTILLDSTEELVAFASTDDWLQKLHLLSRDNEDEDIRNAGWDLLYALVDNDDVKPHFVSQNILVKLLEDTQKLSNLTTLAATLQILGHLAAHDSCLDQIFEQFSVFFGFLDHENSDIKMYTTMAISNIARKDEYCSRLVQAGAVPLLVGLCKDSRSQHYALGALRNIAIPAENKELVANQEGLIELILSYLKDSTQAHTLYNGVLLLKSLSTGGPTIVRKIINAGFLNTLPDLFKKVLQEGHERIFYETGRLVAIIAGTNAEFLDKVVNNNGLQGIKKLLESNFELLHQEGLAVVSAAKSKEHVEALVNEGIVELLIPFLSSSASDLKLKVLVILGNLSQSQRAMELLARNGARQPLQLIAEGDNEQMKIVANKVLSLLPADLQPLATTEEEDE